VGVEIGSEGRYGRLDARKDQLTAAAQVSADRWNGYGLWRAGIVRTAGYALALPDGG
jgi:hypothetical protein